MYIAVLGTVSGSEGGFSDQGEKRQRRIISIPPSPGTHTSIHSSIIQNGQKMERTPLSTDKRMDIQNVVYTVQYCLCPAAQPCPTL